MKREPPEPRDDADRKLLRDVSESGCHIVGVLADENGPAFAYSIGLYYNYGHPEILLFGLGHPLMQSLINGMGDDIQRGVSFVPGSSYPEIVDGFECEFRSVDVSHYRDLFGYARWFYHGNDFPAVQCLWPDQEGRFPWQPEFNPNLLHLQPTYERSA